MPRLGHALLGPLAVALMPACSAQQHFHIEVGGNQFWEGPTWQRLQAAAGNGSKVVVFEPNPRWREGCMEHAAKLGGTCMPNAAWIRDEQLKFHVHEGYNGVAASLFKANVKARSLCRMV